jgi:hypothetical protein
MTQQAPSKSVPAILLRTRELFILHQTLYVATKLGIADRLEEGWRSAAELAEEFKVNQDALYRALRLLASQGIFEEDKARCFRNTEVSNFLRTGVPGSMRSLFIYWGSDFTYPPFGQIMHSIETGEPSRTFLSGVDGFEHLRRDPELARIFDDAMTNMSQLAGPAIAAAYDFGAWGSLMDVGGGSGILLSHILRAHPRLRGVLADQGQVLDRARERGYLTGDLEAHHHGALQLLRARPARLQGVHHEERHSRLERRTIANHPRQLPESHSRRRSAAPRGVGPGRRKPSRERQIHRRRHAPADRRPRALRRPIS